MQESSWAESRVRPESSIRLFKDIQSRIEAQDWRSLEIRFSSSQFHETEFSNSWTLDWEPENKSPSGRRSRLATLTVRWQGTQRWRFRFLLCQTLNFCHIVDNEYKVTDYLQITTPGGKESLGTLPVRLLLVQEQSRAPWHPELQFLPALFLTESPALGGGESSAESPAGATGSTTVGRKIHKGRWINSGAQSSKGEWPSLYNHILNFRLC